MMSDAWTLYGLYDSKCPSLRLSPNVNKLGGYPDFYRECFLTSPPSCECCHSPLILVVQLYCPIEGSPYNRKLHIFSCTQKVCWSKSKSWLVLRSQVLDPSCISQEATSNDPCHGQDFRTPLDTALLDDWCSGAHNWVSNGDLHCKATDQDTLIPSLEALTVRNQEKGMYVEIETPEAIVSESSAVCKARSHAVYVPPYHGPSYPSAYIRVVEGWACRSDDKTVSELLQKYSLENPECPVVMEHWERKEGGRRGRNQARRKMESAGGERYEIATARHGDRAFLKFQKELAKCSHQILRYSWKGRAILMKYEEPELQVDACPICGAERVYECQLMPQMVYIFKNKLCSSTSGPLSKEIPQLPLDSVEFGTVLVYSCSQSCWDNNITPRLGTLTTSTKLDKFRQEYIIVQTETE